MLYIALIACLAADPDACTERYIPVYADVSPMACTMGAQTEIARWREMHEHLVVLRWQCKTDRMIEAAAAAREFKATEAGVREE